MTPQERKYLGRKKTQPINWKLWFVDLMVGLGLALTFVVLVILGVIVVLRITPGVRAETPETNQRYCSEYAEGKWNVAKEDREEVSAYCSNI